MSDQNNEKNPYAEANLLSRISFIFLNKFVSKVKDKPFTQDLHFPLLPRYDVSLTHKDFSDELKKGKNLGRTVIRTVGGKFLMVFNSVLYVALELAEIYILYSMTEYINYIVDNKLKIENLVMLGYFAAIIAIQVILSIIEIYITFFLFNECVYVKNNFIVHILKKALKVNLKSHHGDLRGNIVNLIQIDCQNFETQGWGIFFAFYCVLGAVFLLAISFYLLGVAFFAYLSCSLLFSIINIILYTKELSIEKSLLLLRDKRISFLTNLFTNIRFIKFNTYENLFVKLIYDFRKKEIRLLVKILVLLSFVYFFSWITTTTGLVALMWTYFLIHKNIPLKVYMSFQRISLTLDLTFRLFPLILQIFYRFKLVFFRVSTFLNISELGKPKQSEAKTIAVSNRKNSIYKKVGGSPEFVEQIIDCEYDNMKTDSLNENDIILSIREGNFFYKNEDIAAWNKAMIETNEQIEAGTIVEQPHEDTSLQNNFQLSNINIDIKKGELIFVIGTIGAGKSSLLNAIMGEMPYSENTRLNIRGTLNYCPQNSFLMTKSIKDNITFYDPLNADKLNKAINMAHLEEDIKEFDDGIEKILTENGANLSGGQRLRINLARSFYKNKDIYLLDDPFSALDIHVACHIIENALLGDLRDKTRIVVTHSIQYLKYADRIMYMKEGHIEFFGSFSSFQTTKQFTDLVDSLQTINVKEQKSANDLLNSHTTADDRIVKEPFKEEPKIEKNTETGKFIHKYFLEEDMNTGRQLNLTFKLLRKYYGGLFWIMVIILITFASNFGHYYAVRYLYGVIKERGDSGKPIWHELTNFTMYTLIPDSVFFLRYILITIFTIRTAKNLHNKMMIKAVHGDLLNFYDKIHTSRLINRFSNDMTMVETAMADPLLTTIMFFVILVMDVFIITRSISYWMLLFFFIYFVVINYYQKTYIRLNKEIYRLENITKTPIVNITKEIVDGRLIYKIFNCQNDVISELCLLLNENSKNIFLKRQLTSWFEMKTAMYNVLMIQVVTFAMFFIFIKDNMSPVDFLLFITYLFSLIGDARMFIDYLSMLETQIVSLERCDAFDAFPIEQKYLNYKTEEKVLKKQIEEPIENFIINKHVDNYTIKNLTMNAVNSYKFRDVVFKDGEIVFDSVYAKYPSKNDYVLKNISFKLEKGMKLGICGKTGSGKSSLVKLLVQYLTQESGSITVDGYDITQFDLKKLRSEFLFISQEVALFKGTIKENLKPEYISERNIKKRAKRTNDVVIDLEKNLLSDQDEHNELLFEQDVIDNLISFGFSEKKLAGQGLNFMIENGGANLSLGEQQLIILFRAFYTEKQIVILDEATASVDYQTEKALMDFFYAKLKYKTVISIAHRINSVLKCDQIILLKDGEIVENGTVSDLLANTSSQFAGMYHKINQNLQ